MGPKHWGRCRRMVYADGNDLGRGELHESGVRRKMGGPKAFSKNGIQTMMDVLTFDNSGNNSPISTERR